MSYKKWIHKYLYLQEEYSETETQFQEYVTTFSESFSLKEDENTPKTPLKVDKLPKRIPNNICKPIFKRLSKKLHPDKGGDDNDFNSLSEKYRNQDIIGLYLIAEKYEISLDDLITDEILPLFESSCQGIEKKISSLTKTIAWNWGTITKESERKIAIKYLTEKEGMIYKKPKK